MPRRAWARLALLALAAWLTACAKTSDDAALRAAVAAMTDAIEHKEPKAFVAHMHADFSGPGGLDREGVRKLMIVHFLRNARIHAVLFDMRVQLHGDRAQVLVRAGLAGADNLLPERAQAYDVDSEWVRDGGDWLMRRAEWTPVFDSGP